MNQKTILRTVLIAVLSLVATAATAHDFQVNGIFYKKNGDGTVSVTYQGSSYDEYNGEYTGNVVIPPKVTYSGTAYFVTSIGDDAFSYCSGLTSVTIPNSVTKIDWYAFLKCYGLKSVIIPNSVTEIGRQAFSGCSGLTSVTIPNSVTKIDKYAFDGCSGLTSISIPNSVTFIGQGAFSDCRGLTSIIVNSENKIYDSRENCNAIIEKATNTLHTGCKNTFIPNSVTSIGGSAFSGCSGLTSVTIPNSVTSIGNLAFSRCSGLTSVTIPNSVSSIGEKAFYGCSGLTSVISKAVTPPTCGSNAFSTYSVPLIVPSMVKEAYQAASTWSNFSNYAEPDNKITAIAINNNEAYLVIDNTLQFSATVTPEDATFADVLQWTSSNPEVATVDDNGLVTGIAKGDAEIKVMTCDYSNLSASYTIKVAHYFEVGGIYYKFNGKGTVEVTFKGSSYNEYTNEYTGNVVIPSSVTYNETTYSVTSIGERAFRDCSGLTSVTIPNSVSSIGNYAFYGCSGLTSVTIPNSVTSIGYSAFDSCSGLTSIKVNSENQIYDSRENCNAIIKTATNTLHTGCKNTIIPNSVTSIGEGAFYYCSGLSSITIPNSVTSIGNNAFYGCRGLTSLTIPNSVTSIGQQAFFYCSGLTSVISKAVTPPSCGINAFSTATYSVPLIVPSVAKEEYKAASIWKLFSNYGEPNKKITAIAINNNEANLFINNTLQLSATVTPEDATFADVLKWESSNLEVATVDDNGLVTAIAKGDAEIKATTCDGSNLSVSCTIKVALPTSHNFEVGGIYYKFNGKGTVEVTFQGSSYAYADKYTGKVVIPYSVTYSGTKYSVTSIGDHAFYGCSGLTSVFIPNSVTSIGEYAFEDCSGLTSISIPNSVTSIGQAAFSGCSGLTSVTVPNSVTSIVNNVFSLCRGLTSVTIPNSVTSIGNNAFGNCSDLTSITIPNSVTSIGERAFAGCSGLTSVTIPNSVKSIGEYAFMHCSGLTSIIVDSENQIYDSRENCNAIIETATNTLHTGCKNTNILNSVTSIGNSAFWGCSGLTSITIPNSVKTIGSSAFWDCSGLTSVTIPNSVTEIGNYAFYDCIGLTSVTIPNSVSSIGEYAFRGCSSLTSVTIPNSVTGIGGYVFYGCSSLTSVTIPNSVTSIGNYAFQGCSVLTSVTIPNSVTSIGNYAFENCSGLTSITIGNSVTSIGDYAFWRCLGLTSVISKAVTPPSCGSDVFSTKTYSAPLIVPSVAQRAYKNTYTWRGFSNYAEPERKITAMEFGASTFGIENGETLQLTAKVTPEDATFADVLQWTSSNTEVATVDDEGLVTSLALGSTVITVTSCDGSNISATCTVVVCPKAANVNDLVSGSNIVGFGLQGVKMHDGVLYACTTAESVNMSTPTLHGNNANNMAPYEDRNFVDFDQRDWVAINGLEGDFEGKELSYPFVANFADGVLTPSETISATADATAYTLNTFRAENILHGGYSNYAEGDYTAYYVPARVNEVAKFMGLIETVGGVKYLYSNNAYGRTGGEGIKVENCTIEDNSKVYSLLEGILVADKSTKAGLKIIMLDYLGEATGVEGVDSAAARIYSANGNIIIAAAEDGEAAVYDFTGRLIKSVLVVAGDNTAVPVMPGCYIVRTGVKTQSVVVK